LVANIICINDAQSNKYQSYSTPFAIAFMEMSIGFFKLSVLFNDAVNRQDYIALAIHECMCVCAMTLGGGNGST
jgi:hypothetical protein